MAATAPAAALPTTPPTDYTLTTTGEGALLTQYGSGGIASQNAPSSYSLSSYSHSTPGSDHTVYVGGNGSSSSSSSGVGGWAGLSNTTKYAIYGAAGAAVLLIIVIIAIAIRRSRSKQRQSVEVRTKGLRNSVRMTQRSSFASPGYLMNDATLRSNMPQSPSQHSELRGPPPMMQRTDSSMSYNSMDKSGGVYPPDQRSVHSSAHGYGDQQQMQQPFGQDLPAPRQYYQQPSENAYPPQRLDDRSPSRADQYQYQEQQQRYNQQPRQGQQPQHGYADPHRAISPTYSQQSAQSQGYFPQQHQQHSYQPHQYHSQPQNGHYSHASSQQGYGY